MGDELRSTITDDALDRQLRDASPYIDDAGFTAGVIARLPAPRETPQSLRNAILIGLTLLGTAVAWVVSDSGRFIVVNLVRLAHLPLTVLVVVTFATGLVAVSAAVMSGVVKLRDVPA